MNREEIKARHDRMQQTLVDAGFDPAQDKPFPDCHQDRADLIEELENANGLLWYAWHEFNAIRARDGAPTGISEEFWNEITEKMSKFLGDDNTKPWPSVAAKKIFDQDEHYA